MSWKRIAKQTPLLGCMDNLDNVPFFSFSTLLTNDHVLYI